MKIDWRDWKNPAIVIAIVGGFALLAYTIVFRIPDLEKRTDHMETDVRDQLKNMSLQLVGVRANLLRLCAQKRPIDNNCKVEELVSQVDEVSALQAEFLNRGTVSITVGEEPQVASDELRHRLPVLDWSGSDLKDKVTKPDIAHLIIWSSAADSAKWYDKGNMVEARFANGATSFQLARPLSKKDMTQLVESLNATAGVLQSPGTSSSGVN
jgi:hypothetical protein